MAKLSWKASALLATILLVALGLQASAIKILLDQSARPEPPVAAREPAAAPARPVAPPVSSALETERWPIDPPHSGDPPPVDPPYLVDPAPVDPAPVDPPHLAERSPETSPAPEAPPRDPDPTPAPDPTATALARLADIAAEANAAPPASSPPVPAAPTRPAEPATALQDVEWLRARDARRYTIQLFSGKDLDQLREVSAAIDLAEPRAYFTTGSQTSPWYSLVLGDYPDASTARATAANLAGSLRLKPWIRRFDDIQSSMR
ncbi:MAG: SPOR domain-containing protein [Candidatus Competibacteraceae bacterium]|nr:MAG: SPOR domain-containing protein [Candidatus Competibacteraceae bacterium]